MAQIDTVFLKTPLAPSLDTAPLRKNSPISLSSSLHYISIRTLQGNSLPKTTRILSFTPKIKSTPSPTVPSRLQPLIPKNRLLLTLFSKQVAYY
jgi:hypothetical protein